MLNLRLSEADIHAMIEKYRDEKGDIRYAEFCKYVESAPDPLEKHPEVRPPANINTSPARRKFLNFTDQEKELLCNALENLQVVIRNRRVHLRPMF